MRSNSSSATIGARRRSLVAAAVLLGAACAPVEVGPGPLVETAPETAEPLVRVGLALDVPELAVGGGAAVLLSGEEGGVTPIPQGQAGVIRVEAGAVRARIGSGSSMAMARATLRTEDSTGFVRVNGRDYRGLVTVAATRTGLLAINLVPLEAYVAGVVNAELGRRPPSDSEAVFAQAVVSRTVALRSIGRHRLRGYDLLGTVADQVYGGVGSETGAGWDAVRKTRGEVLAYGGSLIEAFFHSTCGGRTAAVDEVFSGGAQPYLRSIADHDPEGRAFCALSPRFRWREEWSGEALGGALAARAGLGGYDGRAALAPADLRIGGRSPSGRVTEVVLDAGGRVSTIAGEQLIRQVLRPADGGWLRSAQFTVQVGRSGGRLVRLIAEGSGSGHGVGMCQWGAVGRARRGASYREILSAYFPGTEVIRFY